jgi:protocatechuate 4,5-dioxygenase, alpha chain
MTTPAHPAPIPGTIFFDGTMAIKGYALNKMCYSFNWEVNRKEFLANEAIYCDKFGLNAEQKTAIRERNALKLLAAGGNIYYLAKFIGMLGLNVQDIGAQQTGMTVEEFKAKLKAAGN